MRYKIPDAPFQRLAAFLLACFMLVSLGAGYWSVVRADSLYDEWDLRRQFKRELSVDRGRILAADDSLMAETRLDEEGEAVRYYPYPLLAPVTGYWTLQYGTANIEREFDDFLSGQRGQQGLHAFDETMHKIVVGADVITTIQPRLQLAVDQALGDRVGAVIVLDPKTGAILALASRPTFDPNTYTETAEALVTDPQQPTLNRATRGLYTPGSVFKVVTLAGALSQEVTRLDERFENPNGIFIVEGFPIRDGSDLPQRNAPYDLSHALAYSSNVTFAQLALRLNPDGLREIARAFGFGEEPPLAGLPTAASQVGNDAFLLDQVGLANTGYGQGELLVTPLQMALVAAAVANEGVVPEPRIVQEIRSREGETLLRYSPRPWKPALSREVAAEVKQAMIVSATDGFAQAGKPDGITIGGKTGTAQLGGTQEPHAWFIAFAPADDPQIVVAVIAENAGAGGDIAAPIAKQIIQAALAP